MNLPFVDRAGIAERPAFPPAALQSRVDTAPRAHARASRRCRAPGALAAALLACAASANGSQANLPPGTWGGAHIRLVVSASGASVEYDCAYGRIAEPLRPDAEGRFEAVGTHVREPGGPGHADDREPPARPARFAGWTDGRRMRLDVFLPESGRRLGPFSLELGRRAELEKCL